MLPVIFRPCYYFQYCYNFQARTLLLISTIYLRFRPVYVILLFSVYFQCLLFLFRPYFTIFGTIFGTWPCCGIFQYIYSTVLFCYNFICGPVTYLLPGLFQFYYNFRPVFGFVMLHFQYDLLRPDLGLFYFHFVFVRLRFFIFSALIFGPVIKLGCS
jgi:hypothetical protein